MPIPFHSCSRRSAFMDHQFAQRLRSASSASSSVENLSQASRAASTVSGLTSEGHPSPKKSDRIYGDRFIPSRSETDLATAFALRQVPEPRPRTLGKRKAADRGHDSDTLRSRFSMIIFVRFQLRNRSRRGQPHFQRAAQDRAIRQRRQAIR